MAAAARAKPDTVNEGRLSLRPVPRLLKDHRGPSNHILIPSVAQCEIGLIRLEQWLIIRSLLIEKHSVCAPGGAWATPAQRRGPTESGLSVLEESFSPQWPSSPSGLLAQPLRAAGSVPSGTPGLRLVGWLAVCVPGLAAPVFRCSHNTPGPVCGGSSCRPRGQKGAHGLGPPPDRPRGQPSKVSLRCQ